MTQYYLDLKVANQQMEDNPTWSEEYSFRNAYHIPDLNPNSTHQILMKMKEMGDVFQSYRAFFHVSEGIPASEYEPCECVCRMRHICAVGHVLEEPYKNCMEEAADTCSGTRLAISVVLMIISVLGQLLWMPYIPWTKHCYWRWS